MKHNLIKKLIATSIITSSIFSICPTTTFATGVNYLGVGQTRGQWSKQGENWYYYLGGQIQKGWIYDITGWYYTDQKGVMQTGVIQIGGKIYLFADSGVMQTGNVVINGKLYTAGEDGAFYGDELPMPVKAFDWFGTNDNVKHPSQVIDSGKDDSSSTNPTIAYDPLAKRETFQIIFKDEDGEDLKIRNVKDGDSVSLYKPSKKGYTFVEWNTKKDGDGDSYDYDEDVKITKDIKLYAVWEEIEVTDENAEELGIVKVEDITIVSEGKKKEITTDKGTLKLSVDILPVNADNKKVSWSVESETGKATISNKGLLTAEEDGVVIVKATANDGSEVTDSMRISISGQTSGSGSGEGSSGGSGSGSGSGTGSGSGSGNTDVELPVIKGEDILVDNNTNTNLMNGNIYSTIRVSTSGKQPVLQNVKANKLIINGGDHITLDNCQVNYIEVLRPGTKCTVELINGSTAQIVNIERGVTLAGTGYNKVNIKTDEAITVDETAVINTLNVSKLKSNVELNGKVSTMNIASGAVGSIIDGSGSIDKLVNDAINIKLSVSHVGSISGTVGGENTSSDGLINEVKKLEEITKLVEKIEKANLRYVNKLSEADSNMEYITINVVDDKGTDSEEDDVIKEEKITKELSVEDLKNILDKIPSNNTYKSEYDQLSFRLSQLEKSNSDVERIKDARNYVSALEESIAIDPTSTIKFDIKYTTGESVELVLSGGQKTANKLLDDAQYFVDKLPVGLVDKKNLQNKIDSQKAKIQEGMNLKKLITTIKQSTTDSSIGLTVGDYSNAGITKVKDSNLKLVNKYVHQLSKNDDFKEIPYVLGTNLDGSIDKYTITNIINKDKELINNQITSALQTFDLINKIDNLFSSAQSKINNSYYIGGNLFEDKITSVNLQEIKDLFNQATDIKNQLEARKEYVENYDSSIQNRYDDLKSKLEGYAIIVIRREVNDLYVNDVIDSSGTITTFPDIALDLTSDKIKKVSDLIAKFTEEYPDINLSVYGSAVIDADKKYQAFQEVLKGLEGEITIAGKEVQRVGTDYSGYVTFTSDSSKYIVNPDNYNVTISGGGSPLFQVNTTEAAIQINVKSNVFTLKVGEISVTQDSLGNKKGSISFSANSNNGNQEFTIRDASYEYKFKVTIKGEIISNNTYKCTVVISRKY